MLFEDESSTSGAVVDAVTSLCEAHNEDIKNHLANLFQTDDIHRSVRSVCGTRHFYRGNTRGVVSFDNYLITHLEINLIKYHISWYMVYRLYPGTIRHVMPLVADLFDIYVPPLFLCLFYSAVFY